MYSNLQLLFYFYCLPESTTTFYFSILIFIPVFYFSIFVLFSDYRK